ncbi:MAG: hypothetical protein ACXWE6_09885 [Nitrososphaeraceae archaeon]
MFKKPIVIVDNEAELLNSELLNLYSEALQICGYEVCSFSDPILAYDHIRDNPDRLKLIKN